MRPELLTITRYGDRGRRTVEPRHPSRRTRIATCLAAAVLLLTVGCGTAEPPGATSGQSARTTGPAASTTDESSSSSGTPSPPIRSHPSSSEPSISQTTPDAEPHGTVHGTVVREAGRDPRSGGGGGRTKSVPVGADPVTATRADTKEPVARTVTAQDGSFEFNLPPGIYQITEEITGASTKVDVTSQLTSSVTITLPGD